VEYEETQLLAPLWTKVQQCWPAAAPPAPAVWASFRARMAQRWHAEYGLLATALAAGCPPHAVRPPVLAIAGAQGTGKSTLAAHLAVWLELQGSRAAVLGIDDLYLPKAARIHLAGRVHPLLRTRGVPGTHDIALGERLLTALCEPDAQVLRMPRFDKGTDDRLTSEQWGEQALPVQLVIVEGWCLALPPQPDAALVQPVNRLEAEEDPDCVWRRFVNTQLATVYAAWFARFDRVLALLPPDPSAVLRWRTEQEQALPVAQRMDASALRRFVAHYERLTRHAISEWPQRADWCVRLAPDHRIAHVTARA
jgi:D-glycerate 3-kinase